MVFDASQIRALIVQNQKIPKEGSIALLVGPIDLTQNNGLYTVDLSQYEWQNRISIVQALFIDCSSSGVPVAIMDQTTGHEIVANPHTQGFYNFMAVNPTKLQINGPGGPSGFKCFLLNFPVAGMVWAATHP
jgi:hypothetical protein